MASRLAWFLTPSGRKFSFGFMCTASCVAFASQFVPHTFGLYKYREIVSMYEATLPVPLAESVRKRWDEVVSDLSLPQHEVKYIEPFTVFGFDLFRAGSLYGRWGAVIGIPINFTYKSVAKIDASPILVNNEPVNWNRQDAKELLDGLVLGEDAQRYGIAKEVLMTKHNEPLIRAILASFFVSSTYLLSRTTNERFRLLERPLPVRGFCYAMAVFFSFGIWALQIDTLTTYWEKDTDFSIAQLGDHYKRGAVEFYEKMLKRNMALRSLLGPRGENYYTSRGNEKYFFRQPTLPIDGRKKFFIDALKPRTENDDTTEQNAQVAAAPA